MADTLSRNPPIYTPPYYFSHLVYENDIVGCCIYAEPDGLVLSEFAPNTAPLLFASLEKKIDLPTRIFGPKEPTLEIADLYGRSRNRAYKLHSTWRSQILEHATIKNRPIAGMIRNGDPKDKELVSAWGKRYDREKPANVNIETFLLNKLRENNLRFWVDEEPRCLATLSGVICSGPRISAVYTPEEMRGHGYASALVYELGKKFLESGRPYVTLSTQEGDPAERIYARLGYKTVGEKISVVFA